jgi:hypothetical protein
MTSKVYKTAQGKIVDLGTIMLQNEHVRAVGNMGVNARGDKLDSNNRVIDTKPRQIQRQNARTSNVSAEPVQTSTNKARKSRKKAQDAAGGDAQNNTQPSPAAPEPTVDPITNEEPVAITAPVAQDLVSSTGKLPPGGLAAAIARQREVKQELDKTRRQQAQAQGVRKI